MSALARITDSGQTSRHVRKVPIAFRPLPLTPHFCNANIDYDSVTKTNLMVKSKPNTFEALVRAGGPEGFAREAAKQAAQAERQRWLKALERGPLPDDAAMAALHAG